jgi:ABC-type dipeptide/oligopeptide/nickel transport system permease component
MLAYTAKRIGLALLVAFTVSLIAFVLLRMAGDVAAAMAGEGATAQDIEYIRQFYGLDRPLIVQYGDWIWGVLQGDFGRSLYFRTEVSNLIARALPITMTLGVMALCFALIVSIPLGVIAALFPNTWIDRAALTVALVGQAMPSFWFALLLILLFGVTLRWTPISGNATWAHFILPTIALGYFATPAFMRLTRAGMLEVLASDYIRTARAKGLAVRSVLFKHALRNAVIPLVSLAAVQFGFMLGGSIVIETVFALQGMGHLAWESIRRADVAVVQMVILIFAAFYVVLTLLADLLNAFLDPRIRIG